MIVAVASPSPPPPPSPPAAAVGVLTDPCGGAQELLKKYLSASPCVFVRGQASVQATYSGSNTPVVLKQTHKGHTTFVNESSYAIGYPGVLLNIGVTPSSQITAVLPSFSRIGSSQTGSTIAGTADVEFRYKQMLYSDPKHGILGGMLLTYQAPSGSPGLTAPGPAYEINPLLNIALNGARTIGENLSFPVTNAPGEPAPNGGTPRTWSFAPQAVTFWRSPGGTLLAAVVQYGFSTNATYLTLNAAQLLTRNLQIQGTYGGHNYGISNDNPAEDIGPATGIAYQRSFTIGLSYLVGRSEALQR
ncbi:MAG: hypothetical protein WA814_00440 [Candidatus Baltobacteraceae bacterium]